MVPKFESSFIDRSAPYQLDDSMLRRLQRAYRKAKGDPRSSRAEYRVGNEWAPIYEQFMSKFISSLQDNATEPLRELLENFFRRSFSNGLHGLHFEMFERYMTPGKPIQSEDMEAYQQTTNADLDRVFKSVPDIDISKFEVPLVGNPYGFEIEGRFYYGLHHLYFANKIEMLIQMRDARIIELGAGYGGLPWAIKAFMPTAKYIEFDLPEVLTIAAFYIISSFPSARVALFGEVDISKIDELDDFDFVFMPNFEIERIPTDWADLAFNSWSLAEMSPLAVENYVRQLCRIASRYFFHVNHTIHCKVSADCFPIDTQKFRLLHRAPAMWGKSQHRNNFICEHEFLYRNLL